MPLLATFFFSIFFGNIFEVVPGINFSSNSRVAFPLVIAVDRVGHLQRRRVSASTGSSAT